MLPSLRTFLKTRKGIGVAIAAAIFALALLNYFVFQSGSSATMGDQSMLWFYDLNTGERYALRDVPGESSSVAPQPAGSGPLKQDHGPLKAGEPAGVRLMNYGCGDRLGQQFVGFYETCTVAAAQQLRAGSDDLTIIQQGLWRRRPNDEQWVLSSSEAGQQIIDELQIICQQKGKSLVRCEVNEY